MQDMAEGQICSVMSNNQMPKANPTTARIQSTTEVSGLHTAKQMTTNKYSQHNIFLSPTPKAVSVSRIWVCQALPWKHTPLLYLILQQIPSVKQSVHVRFHPQMDEHTCLVSVQTQERLSKLRDVDDYNTEQNKHNYGTKTTIYHHFATFYNC